MSNRIDKDGEPILNPGWKGSPENPIQLKEVVVVGQSPRSWWDRNIATPWNNAVRAFREEDPIFGNRRVRNVQRALQRNPNALDNWQVAQNIGEGLNIMSGGFLNRLSPTQNLRLVYDTATGENVLNSWMGNAGVVPNSFAQEHPYISTGINFALDAGTYRFGQPTVNYAQRQIAPIVLRRQIAKGPMQPIEPPRPQTRYRAGDVEINDPNLNYRQGSPEMVQDFQNTGQVRVNYAGEDAAARVKKPGVLLLTKSFNNPMFKQGGLWYDGHIPIEGGSPTHYNGLLVTRQPLRFATKSSGPAKSDLGGRRIPTSPDQLNPSNTTGYIWEDGYGFRKVEQPQPIFMLPTK